MTPTEILHERSLRCEMLKKMRIRKKISKSALSLASGLARQTIQVLEGKKKKPWNIDSEIIYIDAIKKFKHKQIIKEWN